MEFVVPQFLERKPKIVGPFTFGQFIFIGIGAGISILLYFVLPITFFIIAAIILIGGGLAMAVIKINKIPLPVLIKNFFIFLFKPKVYLWKKKAMGPIIIKKTEKLKTKIAKIETEKEESPLKVAKGSQINNLFTNLETKNR
ncbi:MAG: PrgI family protein [Patescibacteria group bacterium]|nr:PrgI family protein [Patescibacteria group bacterium]